MDELLLVISVVGLGAGLAVVMVGGMFGLMAAIDSSYGWGLRCFCFPAWRFLEGTVSRGRLGQARL